MAVATERDLEQTRQTLAGWLRNRLGVDGVEVSDFARPDSGFSNETMFLTARWSGETHELVLRIEPTGHQLFVQPDVIFQAGMMTALARYPGTPAPHIWFTESDPGVLGAPFYLMDRANGRIPGDVPSWHRRGWTTELSPGEVSTLYDNGLSALVALHRIGLDESFEFLARGRTGFALTAYLEELERWYAWCEPSRIFDREQLDAAYRYLQDHPPADRAEGIVWGDARPGNLMFGDDLAVVAMLDWETATIGPPGIDLGWWLMFEEFLSEAQGIPRLRGVPDRAGIIARYAALGGPAVPDIDYYELLACVVMAMINSKLGVLLMQNKHLSEDVAGEYARRVIRMAGRHLDALTTRLDS